MAQFVLTLNTTRPDRALRRLVDRYPQAVARALNRAGHAANLVVARLVAADMQLNVRDVVAETREILATPTRPSFVVTASATRIPLIKFRARGPEPSRGKGRGVTARTATRRYPRAFIATVGRGGHRGVFERVGKQRLPIRELRGPSVWHVFLKHAPAGVARGEEQLVKNLRHELRFAMGASGA